MTNDAFQAAIRARLQQVGGSESVSNLLAAMRDSGWRISGSLADFESQCERLGFPLEERFRKRPASNGSQLRIACFVHLPVSNAAVRAFRRAWAPQAEAQAQAEVADAGFDAGEWSGPAHARLADKL